MFNLSLQRKGQFPLHFPILQVKKKVQIYDGT